MQSCFLGLVYLLKTKKRHIGQKNIWTYKEFVLTSSGKINYCTCMTMGNLSWQLSWNLHIFNIQHSNFVIAKLADEMPRTISIPTSMIKFGNYLWKLFNIKYIIAESMLMEVGFLLILFCSMYLKGWKVFCLYWQILK